MAEFLLAPTTLSWLGRFWELSNTCTSAVGLCVSPSTPVEFEQCEKLGWGCRGCYQVLALPRPGGCSVASPSSPKFLLSGFSPSGIGHLSTQSARGISPWDFPRSTGQFLSPSQPTLLHPRVPHQPVWPPYKILLSPLLLFILLPHIPIYILFSYSSFCWAVSSSGSLK